MNATKFEAAQIHFLISVFVTVAVVYNRELKIRRRRRQRERQKSNRVNNQNNKFARASRFFEHFFAVIAWLWRENA